MTKPLFLGPMIIPLTDEEILTIFPNTLRLKAHKPETTWCMMCCLNFEGNYTVEVIKAVYPSKLAKSIISDSQGLKAEFVFNLHSGLKQMSRTLSHLHTLTDDQCKAFIKSQNTDKKHKESKKFT